MRILTLKKLQIIAISLWVIIGISALSRQLGVVFEISYHLNKFRQIIQFFDQANERMEKGWRDSDEWEKNFDVQFKGQHELFQKYYREQLIGHMLRSGYEIRNGKLIKIKKNKKPMETLGEFKKKQQDWEKYLTACSADLTPDQYVKCKQRAARAQLN